MFNEREQKKKKCRATAGNKYCAGSYQAASIIELPLMKPRGGKLARYFPHLM
jgi:hypothetical protein